jgi:uncharacterized repeat protein (TIGR01451 family)
MFLGKLGKVGIVLMGVVGAALLGAWLLSASGPEALGTSPATLTFISPIGNPQLTKLGYAVALTNTRLVYTLRCTNIGGSPVSDVTVIDVMPTGLPLVGASPAPDLTALPLLRWSLGTLAAGQVRTLVITTTSPAFTGVITNVAVMGAFQYVMTQSLFATQVVSTGPTLQLWKEASPSTAEAGRTLVYTLRYLNNGNMRATDVVLTDTLPSDVTVVATSRPGTRVGQQLTWNLGDLDQDASGQVVITTTVGPVWGKVLYNVADITGQSGASPAHADLETSVRLAMVYLPLVTKH